MGPKSYQFMKRIAIIAGVLSLFFLVSCDQSVNNEDVVVNDINTQNEAIDLMAKAVAKAMTNPEFRQLIRYETNKQFDYDYDVLYRFIENQLITTEEGGQRSVSEFIIQQISEDLRESSVPIEYFKEITKHIPTLNICVPFQYKDWDPDLLIPKVAAFPVDFDEKTHDRVKCFNTNSTLTWVTKDEKDWELPIVTVGLSERVDENGMVKVNPYDLVIDQNLRTLSADEAYENATSLLKSGKVIEYESIVKIVDFSDPEFIKMINEKHGNPIYSDKDRIIVKEEGDVAEKKSATSTNQVATPKFVEIYPYTTAKSIFLNWNDVGADRYKLYRKINGGSLQYLTTLDWIQGTTYLDQGLTSGNEYLYQIYGEKDGETHSNWSNAVHAEATWRKSNGYERLWSLYLNRDCWSDISWGRSKCEIMMRVVRYNTSNSSLTLEPIGTGGASKKEQRNKTHIYSTRLFRWDFSEHAWNYLIYFYEEDGGSPVTVNLGAKVFFGYKKGQDGGPSATAGSHIEASASISFSIGGRDDKMGLIEINHDEPLGFKYTIPVPRGRAHCYINQE